MDATDWDRMVDRNDPDLDFLIGQRFAAILLLKQWLSDLEPDERNYWAVLVSSLYEERLLENQESILYSSPAIGAGYRDLCRMFLDGSLE